MADHKISTLLKGQVATGQTVTVKGWVRTRRDSKAGLSFIQVHDGTCFDPIQVVAPGDLPNYIDQDALIKESLNEALGLGPLEDLLADDDVEVRRNAHVAMERLSGRPVPFDPEGGPEVRRRAVAALKRNLDRYRTNTETP